MPCTGRGLASRRVATTLVGSYPTVSPLPPTSPEIGRRRFPFCATFRRLSPPGISPASCPVVSGLSSSRPCGLLAVTRPAKGIVARLQGRLLGARPSADARHLHAREAARLVDDLHDAAWNRQARAQNSTVEPRWNTDLSGRDATRLQPRGRRRASPLRAHPHRQGRRLPARPLPEILVTARDRIDVDTAASAARIRHDVELLAGPDYTLSDAATAATPTPRSTGTR